MVAGGCCVAAYPRKTSAHKTLHPAVAKGHGGMESGGVGGVSIGGAIAYRRLPSDIPTGMKTCANGSPPQPQRFSSPAQRIQTVTGMIGFHPVSQFVAWWEPGGFAQ
jgi:hypothetical protein